MYTRVKYFHSFKFKITLLVTAMVLIAAVGVGGISLYIAENEMRHVIAEQEMAVLKSTVAFIDSDLHGKQLTVEALVEEISAHKLGLHDIQKVLTSHSSLRKNFFNVVAFDMEGRLIANLNEPETLGSQNVQNSSFFRETLRQRKGISSEPFRSKLSNRPVIVVTHPVSTRTGEICAVLVAAIDLTNPSFAEVVDGVHRQGNGYNFIVASDGTIIHHRRKALVFQPGRGNLQRMRDAALNSNKGWTDELTDDSGPTLLVHRRLQTVNWTVASAYPIQTAFAPMDKVRLRALSAATALTVLAGVCGGFWTKTLLRPLRRLQRNVEGQDGASPNINILDVPRQDEFGLLSRTLYSLSKHRDESEKALHQLATTDVLTGVHNRRMFDEFLPRAIARAARAKKCLALAYLDLDRFKSVNDTYGHASGDAVLIEFARRLSGAVRCTDTVVRLAGDEFVIVFEFVDSALEAATLGDKLLLAMSEPFKLTATAIKMTTSVGIALTDNLSTTPDELMRAADEALYKAKAAGRNGYAMNDNISLLTNHASSLTSTNKAGTSKTPAILLSGAKLAFGAS